MIHPMTGAVEAYARQLPEDTNGSRSTRRSTADLDFLEAQLTGEFDVTSRTDADDPWIVSERPGDLALGRLPVRPHGRTLTKLYVTRPELEGAHAAADAPDRDPAARRPDPGLLPDPAAGHATPTATGGRASRCRWCCWSTAARGAATATATTATHQWLANRGYAVLSANFRASTGFGKKFSQRRRTCEWGRKMHDDLIDAVDWAVAQGITAPDKVAIMGGSYGGYATLAGLTFTPECSPAASTSSARRTSRPCSRPSRPTGRRSARSSTSAWATPTTPEGQALLQARSPLYKADRISRPLLIGQGANDPRVKPPSPSRSSTP